MNLFVGKSNQFTENIYWRAYKYITEVDYLIGIHGQGTDLYLDYLVKQYLKGQLWSCKCITNSTPANNDEWLDTVHNFGQYLYCLEIHRNILHGILVHLQAGEYETAKVSIAYLAKQNIHYLQWIAHETSRGRAFRSSGSGSGTYTPKLKALCGATSSALNSWSISPRSVTQQPIGRYRNYEGTRQSLRNHRLHIRQHSDEILPALDEVWSRFEAKLAARN